MHQRPQPRAVVSDRSAEYLGVRKPSKGSTSEQPAGLHQATPKMASNHLHHSSRQHSLPQSRLRSSSDPFVDPSASVKRPPPLPPKTKSSSRMPAALAKSPPRDTANRDITEAVRDTVQVRGTSDSNPRARVGRSQTAATPLAPASANRPAGRRSQSQDSAPVAEKSKSSGKGRAKKGSQHADVIDRLDFTGVGPMFHHDGPFDACAPSRNRQKNKAPMFAWSARPEDAPVPSNDSAYPGAHAYKAFTNDYEPPKKKVDAIAEAWGIHEPEPYEEFFAGGGTGRPEGDTPASSIYNGRDSHNSHSTNASGAVPKRTKDGRDGRNIHREHLEDGHNGGSRPRAAVRRSVVPPPQPIFVPDAHEVVDVPGGSPMATSPGGPKRSKSLMHRIRKMRDAPNVPVGNDVEQPPSPSSPTENTNQGPGGNAIRPTHRPQNSFLGRFGGASKANQLPPTAGKPEAFVYIDPQSNKALPATPLGGSGVGSPAESAPTLGYFDESLSSGGPGTSPGQGLGRKTSLMKKVGRVVRGNR